MSTILRKTKVIATIGPACDDLETLKSMIQAGMNVARLNMSHGTPESHKATLLRIREAEKIVGGNVAVMVDTKGREIRTGKLKDGSVLLERQQKFSLYCDERMGDDDGVSVSYTDLYKHVSQGDAILLDDGYIELSVEKTQGTEIICQVEYGGLLKDTKGVNLPGNKTAFDGIPSNTDKEVKFSAENNVQYIAASFIRNAQDVIDIRNQLKDYGVNIPIIAKIENREGIENLDEIIKTANGVMVARGDLGVELNNLGEGPKIQKKIIRATVSRGKPVITATQMLDSMERNPRPTRAEVSDVANAIFDGSSAVMLSGETAVGTRPVEAVTTMVQLAREAEKELRRYGYLQQIDPHPSNDVTEAVAQASITMANHLNAAAIFALTETGFTSRLISKYRPDCPILAITKSSSVVSQLVMNWGVLPIHYQGDGSDQDRIDFAINQAKKLGYVQVDDVVIMTAGSSSRAGGTDSIRVMRV